MLEADELYEEINNLIESKGLYIPNEADDSLADATRAICDANAADYLL